MLRKVFILAGFCLVISACKGPSPTNENNNRGDDGTGSSNPQTQHTADDFLMGVDLSYDYEFNTN